MYKMKLTRILPLILVFFGSLPLNAQYGFPRQPVEKRSPSTDTLYLQKVLEDGWSQQQGIWLQGAEGLWYATGNPVYYNLIQRLVDRYVSDKGELPATITKEITPEVLLLGREILWVYKVSNKEKYFKAVKAIWEGYEKKYRTGNYEWKEPANPESLVAYLFMGSSFIANYAISFHQQAALEALGLTLKELGNKLTDHTYLPEKGLSAQTMAYYGAALVDFLELAPASNPHVPGLKNILVSFVKLVEKYQHPATGLWPEILTGRGAKQKVPDIFSNCLLVYTLAKSVRLGFLAASGLQPAKKSYNSLLNSEKFIQDSQQKGAFLLIQNEMKKIPLLAEGKGLSVVLDDYYNAEKRKDITGTIVPFHYKWNEYSNPGFSFLGNIFRNRGIATKTLSEAPTSNNLKDASIYLIVDADNQADNPTPNYMQTGQAEEIFQWVKAGGVLVLLHNDKGNAEFAHFNFLSDKFGIHFNEDSHNPVLNDFYPTGAVLVPKGNPVLPGVNKIYQKEICSFSLTPPAKAFLQKDSLVIFAVAKVGKGTVFATGDPWLYNEYLDGRKIPAEYQNFEAANELISWLIRQVPGKRSGTGK